MPARIPMTERQRAELLALPATEQEVVRHYSLDDTDLTLIAKARTPATKLGYALQLCCLRFPGRYLRRGEVLPAVMLDYIAEQVNVDAEAIAVGQPAAVRLAIGQIVIRVVARVIIGAMDDSERCDHKGLPMRGLSSIAPELLSFGD